MKTVLLASVTMLSLSAGSAFARMPTSTLNDPAFPSPNAGQTVFTPRGPVMTTTGSFGEMQTITLPGGGPGVLIPNTNGTSTLIGPDGTTTTVQTPSP